MNVESTAITLIGVPLEEGSGRRGAGMGPTALRIAGIETMLRELQHRVTDSGDLRPAPATDLPEDPKAHNLKIVGAFTRALEAKVYEVASAGNFPLILGGDHSL
ncbi:MAG: arginase family protein, partial [Rhizobiaceae bacterium]|nr:arginase family protein [Rhizobiaceae bacterium]